MAALRAISASVLFMTFTTPSLVSLLVFGVLVVLARRQEELRHPVVVGRDEHLRDALLDPDSKLFVFHRLRVDASVRGDETRARSFELVGVAAELRIGIIVRVGRRADAEAVDVFETAFVVAAKDDASRRRAASHVLNGFTVRVRHLPTQNAFGDDGPGDRRTRNLPSCEIEERGNVAYDSLVAIRLPLGEDGHYIMTRLWHWTLQ